MKLISVARLAYRNFRADLDPGSLTILIVMPAIFLVFLGMGYGSFSGSGSGAYLSFLAPGIMASEASTAGLFSGSMLWSDRRWGMLAQLLMGPFTRTDYLISNALTSTSIGVFASTAMLLLYVGIGGKITFGLFGLGVMYASLVLGSVLFSAVFLIIAVLVKSSVTFNSIQNILIFFLTFASTVFYPVSRGMPLALRVIVEANPLTYVADLVRSGFSGEAGLSSLYGLGALALGAAVGLLLASWVYSHMKIYTQRRRMPTVSGA